MYRSNLPVAYAIWRLFVFSQSGKTANNNVGQLHVVRVIILYEEQSASHFLDNKLHRFFVQASEFGWRNLIFVSEM